MKQNYLFKVVLWNDSINIYGAEETEYRVVQAETFSEAVEILEEYYGKDLISFEVGCIEYEPILLTEENFKKLWREHINDEI